MDIKRARGRFGDWLGGQSAIPRDVVLRMWLWYSAALVCGMLVLGTLIRPEELVSWAQERAHALRSLLVRTPHGPEAPVLDHLQLKLKYEDYQRLAYARQIALERGLLMKSDNPFVPVEVTWKGHTQRGDIRLKGDYVDHLQDPDRWSFRLKLQEGMAGMRTLSLQLPERRLGINEWLYLETLRREGVIAPRYFFLHLSLGEKDLGVYALEEHFQKYVLEGNKQREGPILKLDEEGLWKEALRVDDRTLNLSRTALLANGGHEFAAASLLGFEPEEKLDPDHRAALREALQLWEGLREGKLRVPEVVDVEKTARFLAVSELLCAHHALAWSNARYFRNSVTGLFEPIGFDGMALCQDQALVGLQLGPGHDSTPVNPGLDAGDKPPQMAWWPILDILMGDRSFYAAYVRSLERMARPEYLTELFTSLSKDLERNEAALAPAPPFDVSKLRERQEYIRSSLAPADGLRARPVTSGTTGYEVGNLLYLPLEVTEVACGQSSPQRLVEPLLLPGRRPGQVVRYISSPVNVPCAKPPTFRYRVLGASVTATVDAATWPPADPTLLASQRLHAGNLERFPALKVDKATHTVTLPAGKLQLSQTMIIPRGYRLLAEPGAEVDLVDGASLIVWGPVTFGGLAEAPIRVGSSDGKGGGVAVLAAGGQSTLRYVLFEGLSPPHEGQWKLTGAVTFYESPVTVDHSAFIDAHAEDALNLVRSRFEVTDSRFARTKSDAFDLDFSDGTLRRTRFERCGNDCVDLSGSTVEIDDVQVYGAGDKGLSCGEASTATVHAFHVQGANIGLAAKDLSLVRLEEGVVEASQIGVAAYQKKGEFGSGRIQLAKFALKNVARPYLVEEGAQVETNGTPVAANATGLRQELYSTP